MQANRIRGSVGIAAIALLSVVFFAILLKQEAYGSGVAYNNKSIVAASTAYPVATCQSFTNLASRPLRDMKPIVSTDAPSQGQPDHDQFGGDTPKENGLTNAIDPVVQRSFGPLLPAMDPPIQVWDGMFRRDYQNNYNAPPDTDGEAGLNYYVQAVNVSLQVWTKSGTPIYGPFAIRTLWQDFQTDRCYQPGGDPIVLYDQLADRWIISKHNSNGSDSAICIAVSQTEDPTGSWNLYDFTPAGTPTPSTDQDKFGVWPDGYYMSDLVGSTGHNAYVFNRDQMLAGQAATCQVVATPITDFILPSDLDGYTLPPFPSQTVVPNYFVSAPDITSYAMTVYGFHVDWANPTHSHFAALATVTVDSFSYCGLPCFPRQPETSERLQALDPILPRVAYRNFGDHEAMVLSQNVSVDNGTRAGVRWYELRNPSTSLELYQSGTFAPGTDSRFYGSMAMDWQGDIGLGYTTSGSSTYPSVRYSGRLPTDNPGQLRVDASILEGTGSQLGPGTQGQAWGDYSGMRIDPADDCTFWYTNEYNRSYGMYWRTSIGAFRFAGCTPRPTRTPSATPTGKLPTNTPTNTPTYTPTVTPTPTNCTLQFNDVPTSDPFYSYIICLYCKGIVEGYPCGGVGEPCPGTYYRPSSNSTRGQLAKIITMAAGFSENLATPSPSFQTFSDVPRENAFWLYVERSVLHELSHGYPCSGIGEPCDSINTRYFRPNADASRGQLAKMVSTAAGFSDTIPDTRQTFQDVAPGSTFYTYTERLAERGIVSGYPCGGTEEEPCVPPANRPYYRPNYGTTRAQSAKVVARTFFPECNPPNDRPVVPGKPGVPNLPETTVTTTTTTTPQATGTVSVPTPVPSVPAPLPSVPIPVPTGPLATVTP